MTVCFAKSTFQGQTELYENIFSITFNNKQTMKLLVVCDESSKIIGHRYLNSQISFYIGVIQFGVCIWATAQHIFSIVRFKKVLHCDFVNGTKPALLVGVDIIIFDIGLFHSLWDIESCVAQHLDGGYALLISLPFAFVSRPPPCALWPLLIQLVFLLFTTCIDKLQKKLITKQGPSSLFYFWLQQSAYGIGLLILSLSALPRILPIFTGYSNGASLFALAVYIFGTAMNSFLLYVYWHWYWHVESMWNSARKLRPNHIIVNPNMRSKRTLMRPPPDILNNVVEPSSDTPRALLTTTSALSFKIPFSTSSHNSKCNETVTNTFNKRCSHSNTFNTNTAKDKSTCPSNYSAINNSDDDDEDNDDNDSDDVNNDDDEYSRCDDHNDSNDEDGDNVLSNENSYVFDQPRGRTVSAVTDSNKSLPSALSTSNNVAKVTLKSNKSYCHKDKEFQKYFGPIRECRVEDYETLNQLASNTTLRKYKICSNYYEEVLAPSQIYHPDSKRTVKQFRIVRKLPIITPNLLALTPQRYSSGSRSACLKRERCYDDYDVATMRRSSRRLLPTLPYLSLDV
uniref:G_PROTEIN_RECEP_F1_2 domain-containing protein n=1 Tax=Syphacia muris TaxID=451379 RepID=A0A0N5AUQ5_9BILA